MAMAELEERLRPAPRSGEQHLVWDTDTGTSRWEPTPWTEEELEEAREGFGWSDAIELAKARHKRRKGVEMSPSYLDTIKQGLRFTKVGPLELDTREVRRMVLRMEEKGHKASTIQQRCAGVSAVIEAMIRSGEYPDHNNPFLKVDTAAAFDPDSHKTAEPDEYRQLWARRHELEDQARIILEVLVYSGARISEVLNASYEPGWMIIRPTRDWQPKNKTSAREVPLPGWMDVKGMGFTITADGFRARYRRIRDGLEITPHSFRHGWKTASRMAGCDELTAETILGHAAGTKMSRTYGHYPRELLVREASRVWDVLDSWCGNGR